MDVVTREAEIILEPCDQAQAEAQDTLGSDVRQQVEVPAEHSLTLYLKASTALQI